MMRCIGHPHEVLSAQVSYIEVSSVYDARMLTLTPKRPLTYTHVIAALPSVPVPKDVERQ